jgi:hypothetical protein
LYEKHIGLIPKGFVVHHMDGNRLNNTLGNLILLSKADHDKQHSTGVNNGMFGRKHSGETKRKWSEMRSSLSTEQEAKILEYASENWPQVKIASEFNVTKKVIWRVVNNAGKNV